MTFDVDRVDRVDGTISALDASFSCGTAQDRVTGAIRWHSQTPLVARTRSRGILDFPITDSGSSSVLPVVVRSAGTEPLHVGTPVIEGPDDREFRVLPGGCAEQTLDPDEECTVQVEFDPDHRVPPSRYAVLRIPDDAYGGGGLVKLFGYARVPTTTRIQASDNADGPPGSATVTARVDPTPTWPEFYPARWLVDGVQVDHYGPSLTVGAGASVEVEPGPHSIQARFIGGTYYAPSLSDPVVVVTYCHPDVTLDWAPWGDPTLIYITGRVTLCGAAPTAAGKLTLTDQTTGRVLAMKDVVAPTGEIALATSLSGTHDLRLSYTGLSPYFLPGEASRTVNGTTDVTVPAIGATAVSLKPGALPSATSARVSVAWSASGNHHPAPLTYQVQQRADGGAWTTIVGSGSAVTTTERVLERGKVFRFRARASDAAGNTGAWTESRDVRVEVIQQSSRSVSWAGRWWTASSPAFSAGSARSSRDRSASATLRFTGRSVGWVASMGPARGPPGSTSTATAWRQST